MPAEVPGSDLNREKPATVIDDQEKAKVVAHGMNFLMTDASEIAGHGHPEVAAEAREDAESYGDDLATVYDARKLNKSGELSKLPRDAEPASRAADSEATRAWADEYDRQLSHRGHTAEQAEAAGMISGEGVPYYQAVDLERITNAEAEANRRVGTHKDEKSQGEEDSVEAD